MRHIIIYGASNPEDLRLARAWTEDKQNLWELGLKITYWDDERTGFYLDLPIEKPSDAFKLVPPNNKPFVFNCVCSNTAAREQVYNRIWELGCVPEPLVANTAILADPFQVQNGQYIQDRVVVQDGCKLGRNISIHMGSLIGHETIIEPHAFIAHGVNISGRCFIGERAYIGAGATILPDIIIGPDAVVGAGAVVTKDVLPGITVKGVPAK